MLQSIVQTLISLGPVGLFLLAVMDSAGIPLPAAVDTLLITLAIGNPSLAYLSAALAIAGSAAGCMVLFYVARKGGELYLERQTRTARAQRFRRWFLRYGLVTVFIPTLVPIPLPTKVFVISAGVFGIRAVPFLLVVLVARIPRYFGLAYLGSQLGEHSTVWLREHAAELTGIAVGLFVFLLLLVRLTERFRKPSARLG